MGNNDINDNDNAVVSSTNEVAQDVEGEKKKLKYPRSIGFIISNEFCERFNYYGMRTILVLYLIRVLHYSDDSATVLYHTFTSLVYFMCIFGAIIADSWLGKFKTILILSIVYAIGSGVITLGAIPPLNLPMNAMTLLGLFLIALGSGGIKPCVAAFGGDQFKIPEQAAQIGTFFSLFYFAINAGSLISTTVTPILREDVKCFEDDACFSLAFGVPGVLMVVSILIFLLGKRLYIMIQPTGNMLVKVSKCIGNAIATKIKERKTNPKEHWLDYAEPNYGATLVSEVKTLLNVIVLYIPLPVFWTLFDQQGSRWTLQATRMVGTVGGWEIKPDQLQVLNPLLILVFIPLYDVLFYPLLDKIGIRRPLQKLTMGGIFAGIAFICSGIVELELQKTYPLLPESGIAQVRVFNVMQCDYTFNVPDIAQIENKVINSMQMFTETQISMPEAATFSYTLTSNNVALCPNRQGTIRLTGNTAWSFYIYGDANTVTLQEYEDDVSKPRRGNPHLRILGNIRTTRTIIFRDVKSADYKEGFKNVTTNINMHEISGGTYQIYIDESKVETGGEVLLQQGGAFTILLYEVSGSTYVAKLHVVTMPNTMHMLWLVPQYVIMTLGEVMYSVTGLQFSYSQAPASMKSVLQACWQLTIAVGNIIVIIVAEAKSFDSQAAEFFLFAGLMFIDMIVFAFLAMRYKYVEPLNEAIGDTASDETMALDERKGKVNESYKDD